MEDKITTYLSRQEKRFFDVAKAVSRTSNYPGQHVGCCIVYRGVVVSVATNCEKTHPLQKKYNKFRNFNPQSAINKLHAEVHAISLISDKRVNWAKASIYVYRELKSGKPAVSKPCPACSQLIKDLKIPYVYYVDESGRYIKESR